MKVQWIEDTIRSGLGQLSETGALAVTTGRHTGRAVNSRFIVRRPETETSVNWGEVNRPFPLEDASRLFQKLQSVLELEGRYRLRRYSGGFPIEVISTSPWHALFAENMFRATPIPSLANRTSGEHPMRVWHHPYGKLSDFGVEGQDGALILLDVFDRQVAIIGTAYAGEIKKSAFSICNYLLPELGLLPMHASANTLEDGTGTCLLFGLSGTGKTTLSADPNRYLIGDDEIVWSERGLTNLEGGCYAKLIDLDAVKEPEIHSACAGFGAILENVELNPETRRPDYFSRKTTENTRGSYPLSCLGKVFPLDREAEAPRQIVFLSADAFGALPMVSRLDPWQAQYHFISGYTAKVAGTEIGVKEPKATFSACFGAPFMPRAPSEYARLLAQKVEQHKANVWLLNTGWFGGFGQGSRFPLPVTRQVLNLIQCGVLEKSRMRRHPVFGFEVPLEIPGVDPKYLESGAAGAGRLAEKFVANMSKFGNSVGRELRERGGPVQPAL